MKRRALEFCNRAKEGHVHITEFWKAWPKSASGSPFLAIVRDDLEDAIQHFPASIITRAPAWEEWYRSDMYRTVIVDGLLLGAAGLREEELALIRRDLQPDIEDTKTSEADLHRKVARLVSIHIARNVDS